MIVMKKTLHPFYIGIIVVALSAGLMNLLSLILVLNGWPADGFFFGGNNYLKGFNFVASLVTTASIYLLLSTKRVDF